jgi:nicotinamide N-methyltransferase
LSCYYISQAQGSQGFTWGSPLKPILDLLPPECAAFDLVILSDLVFNHSQHQALLNSCKEALNPEGVALCFYAHHRPTPELIKKDQGFIQLATEQGWRCEKVVEDKEAGVRSETRLSSLLTFSSLPSQKTTASL